MKGVDSVGIESDDFRSCIVVYSCVGDSDIYRV